MSDPSSPDVKGERSDSDGEGGEATGSAFYVKAGCYADGNAEQPSPGSTFGSLPANNGEPQPELEERKTLSFAAIEPEPEPEPELELEPEPEPEQQLAAPEDNDDDDDTVLQDDADDGGALAGFIATSTPMRETDGVFGAKDGFAMFVDGARFIPESLCVTNVTVTALSRDLEQQGVARMTGLVYSTVSPSPPPLVFQERF